MFRVKNKCQIDFISNNMSWNTLVTRVATNGNRSLGFIKRNVINKSPKVIEMAYQTIVRPQLEYASAIWDPHTKENAHKIEMARWTMNDYARTTSVTSLLHQLDWQTLLENWSVARLCLFYKVVNGLVAVPLPDKPNAYSECACSKSITLSEVKGQPV